MKTRTEVASFWSTDARQHAAALIRAGRPVGAFNRGVCAIWGDASNPRFVGEVERTKGAGRHRRPLALTLPAEELVQLLDPLVVPPELKGIFLNARELTARLGSLCFIRARVTKQTAARLPASVVSWSTSDMPYIQNWDACGHRPAYLLVEEMLKVGVRYPGITSMNISGEPEIVDQDAGLDFAKRFELPLFLADPVDKGVVRGSYTILSLSEHGTSLVRDGNIPAHLLERIIGADIDAANSLSSNFPGGQLSWNPPMNARASQVRLAMLAHLRGWDNTRISRLLDVANRFRLAGAAMTSDGNLILGI